MSKDRKKPGRDGRGAVVTDSRFAALHTDPRFQRFPKAKRNVEIDQRFAGVFKDPMFQVRASVDKRGRKVDRDQKNEDMRRYYRLKDEEADQAASDASDDLGEEHAAIDDQPTRTGPAASKGKGKDKDGSKATVRATSVDDAATSSGEDDEETQAAERWARARGLAGPSESSSSEEEWSYEEEDMPQHSEERYRAEFGVGGMAANPAEPIPLGDETSRLAVVDLDWSRLRAVDIMAVLRSFLPKAGRITRVTVYPSDFGMQRMKEEAVLGPQGIYTLKADSVVPKEPTDNSSSDDGSSGNDGKARNGTSDAADTDEEEGGGLEAPSESDDDHDGGDINKTKLRLYERSKLRYYYAIVDCDSVATAAALYEECDDMDFQHSACKFDLRFVPDEQSFEGREVRDSATEVPPDYAPPHFQTAALQHTNVKLTWDADDDSRKRTLHRRLNEDQIREDDFKAYLASEGDESEEDAEPPGRALHDKYRTLLLAGDGNCAERKGGKVWATANGHAADSAHGSSSSDEEDAEQPGGSGRAQDEKMEMEVTFTPGLESLGSRLLAGKREREARKGETVWEAYMRRRREKRQEAKAKGKHNVESESDSDPEVASDEEDGGAGNADPFFQHDEDPFSDPFFQDDEGGKGNTQAAPGPASDKNIGKDPTAQQETAKAKRGQRKEQEADEKRRQAELELLLMDESALQDVSKLGGELAGGAPARAENVSRKQKLRAKKARRQAERQAGSDDEDLDGGAGGRFNVDLEDPRFQDLFRSHHFALDPTDPQFNKSGAAAAIAAAAAEQQRSRGLEAMPATASTTPDEDTAQQKGSAGTHLESVKLKAMVAALKRKAGAPTKSQPGSMKQSPQGLKKPSIKHKRQKKYSSAS